MEIEESQHGKNKGQSVRVRGLDHLTHHQAIGQLHEASLEHHVHKYQEKTNRCENHFIRMGHVDNVSSTRVCYCNVQKEKAFTRLDKRT